MANARGIDGIFSIIKGTTWGTAGTVNAALKGVRPLSWDVDEGVEPLPDDSYNGSPSQRMSVMTASHKPSGSFEIDCKYAGLDIPFGIFYGTSAISGANPYLHTYTLKSDMTGIFASLAWYDGVATYTVSSAKFDELTLSASAGQCVKAKFHWVGHKYTRALGNNLGSVTEPSTIDRVQYNAATSTYSVAADGGSLAAWSPGVANWTVTQKRDYTEVFTGLAAPFRDEFIAGRFTVTGSLQQMPKTAITYQDYVTSGAAYKLKFGHVLSASTKEMNLWLPHARFIKTNDAITTTGGIPLPLDFRCDLATTAQSGYPSTQAGMTFYNDNSADPLA